MLFVVCVVVKIMDDVFEVMFKVDMNVDNIILVFWCNVLFEFGLFLVFVKCYILCVYYECEKE